MKSKNSVLEVLVDRKVYAILKLFLENQGHQFYLLEIAKKAQVSPASTMRIVQFLVKNKFIKQVNISRFKLYILKDSPQIRILSSLMGVEK